MRPISTPPPLFPDAAAAAAFAEGLPTHAVGRRIEYHAGLDSTNDRAAQAAAEGAPHGTVIVAEEQRAGRGRRGRRWTTPPGKALLCSVLLRPEHLPPERLGWVALAAGLAAAEAVAQTAPLVPDVKWPNDIVVAVPAGAAARAAPGWRKLGGVLCENVLAPGQRARGRVVAGIGLNVLQEARELPAHAKAPPSSILLETGQAVKRLELLAKLLQRLDVWWSALAEPAGFAALQAELDRRLRSWWQGRSLRVRTAGGEVEGRFAGLDVHGRLGLDSGQGQVRYWADAEILEVS